MAESLSRKSVFIVVMNLAGAVIAYLGFFVIARYMPQGEQIIGLVTFSTGYLTVFLPVSKLGFPQAHTKRVSEGADLGQCNGAFVLVTAILTAVMSAVVVLTIIIWTVLLRKGFETREELDAIWIMFGYNILAIIANIPSTTFAARREMAKSQIGPFAGHVARVASIAFVAFSGLGGIDIVWAYFVGGAATMVSSLYLFKGYPVRWPDRQLLRSYFNFAKPLILPTILSTLPLGLAPVLIQYYWHLTYTGYFGAAYRIVAVFLVLGASVANVIFPKISELHSMGGVHEIRNNTMEAERLLGFILAPLSFFLLFYATGVINVMLKDTFLGATSSLWALSIWLYISSVSQPKNNLIPAMNDPKKYGMVTALSSIVSVALMIFLIPGSLFGIAMPGLRDFGASIAMAAGAVVTYVLSDRYSKSISGTRFEYSVLIYPAIAIISCLLIFPLTTIFSPLLWKWYTGLMFALAVAAVYLLLCLLTRTIEMREIRLLWNALDPFEMHSYVSDELTSKYRE